MKKSFILLPMLMLMLSACGGGGTSSSSSSTTSGSSSSGSSTPEPTPVEVNYGSLEAPLTVGTFLEEAGKLNLSNGEFSKKHFFVQGVAQTYFAFNESYDNYDKFKLGESKTSDKTIDVSGAKRGEGISDVYQNDTFVVEGLAEKYNNALCIYFIKDTDYPVVQKLVTRGESTATVAAFENGKVDGLMDKYENGKTAEFTVTVDSGFKIDSVKVYGNALTLEGGKYSFVVKGDVEVKVTIVADAPATHLARYDFSVLKDNGTETTAATLKAAIDSSYKDGTSGNMLSEVTSTTKVFNGNGSGGAYSGKAGMLKFGTSTETGTFTIKLTGTVSKVTLGYHDFYKLSTQYPATSNTFEINGVAKANPYNDTGEPQEVVFELTVASDELVFKANGRAVLFTMVFE